MKIRIRRLLVPVLFCLAVACLIEIPLAETTIFGEDTVLWDTLFRAILAVPALVHFYREDRVFRGKESFGLREAGIFFAAGAVLSLASGWLLRLAGGADYRAVNESLLTGNQWLMALTLLAASPLLEELFFRGVIYQRLKEMVSPVWAAVLSAAFFGLYHGNVSQGIYGFFMGLFLAYSMEKCQTVKAPVLIHFAANLAALVSAAMNLP